MSKLAELAVTSHRPTLRTTAGQTFLTFLLHYPLGEKRLQFHLNQVRSRRLYFFTALAGAKPGAFYTQAVHAHYCDS